PPQPAHGAPLGLAAGGDVEAGHGQDGRPDGDRGQHVLAGRGDGERGGGQGRRAAGDVEAEGPAAPGGPGGGGGGGELPTSADGAFSPCRVWSVSGRRMSATSSGTPRRRTAGR